MGALQDSLFGLKGRVALVTGGSKGLGKAMARALAEAGADIVISSRSEEELKASLEEILKGLEGVRAAFFVADMTNRDAVKRLAEDACNAFEKGRGVDILVNNAGSNVPQAIDDITDEAWDQVLELNLSSCMALTRALVPGMKEKKWGRVIYTSSIHGFGSVPERSAYSATKAALIGMCKAQALELGPYNVTVNCIAPGPFLTDLPANLFTEDMKKSVATKTAVNRWGDPKELAGPILLLATDAGSYITGATILVDGGVLARNF